MNNKEWFKNARYGMMVHFGLYSLLGGEWNGQRMPHIGEWAQSYFRIPNTEYSKLANIFNPIYFNSDEWVKLAIDGGMKYLVVTSKHHDGFALYHSKVNKYNVVDATPFGRDIIEELANSCSKYGLKLGLYYSQELDWEQENGGGYNSGHTNCECMSWTNDWDFPNNENKNFKNCFEGKIKPQVEEIIKNYGDLCVLWFDTPLSISKPQSLELYNLVRKHQKDCLINSRIGNDLGDYHSLGDNEISDHYFNSVLVETAATINDTWGYKAYDQTWKDADEIYRIKNHLNERGINYLLNVGPDYLGRIPAPSINVIREVGKK